MKPVEDCFTIMVNAGKVSTASDEDRTPSKSSGKTILFLACVKEVNAWTNFIYTESTKRSLPRTGEKQSHEAIRDGGFTVLAYLSLFKALLK